jgi:hypothetical protein
MPGVAPVVAILAPSHPGHVDDAVVAPDSCDLTSPSIFDAVDNGDSDAMATPR